MHIHKQTPHIGYSVQSIEVSYDISTFMCVKSKLKQKNDSGTILILHQFNIFTLQAKSNQFTALVTAIGG